MARITVEDCIDKFPSRFELVLIASNRARKLYAGENPTVEKDNDKNTVIALREIAEENFTIDQLKNNLIEEYQTVTFSEEEDLNEDELTTEEISDNNDNNIEDLNSTSESNTDDSEDNDEVLESSNDEVLESSNDNKNIEDEVINNN